MKMLVLIFSLFFALSVLSAATWYVRLYDSYGDGWNGGTLTVMVNSIVVLNNITLAAGNGPEDNPITIYHGDRITTIYTPGSWPYENEYSFINQWGQTAFASGVGTDTPTSIIDPFLAAVHALEAHQIGTAPDTGSEHLPIYPYFGYSYSQSLYLRSEFPVVLGSRRISKLMYRWNGVTSASHSQNWTIYIGHTTRSQFNSVSDWVPLTELTKVFQGSVNMVPVIGWVEITLDRPFDYDGVSNLVVAVDENTDLYDSSNGKFLQTPVAAPRSLIYYDDYANPDPAAPPNAWFAEANIPNIIFQVNPIIWKPCSVNFDQSAIPMAWAQYSTSAIASDRWSISNSNIAGGMPNEMKSSWINAYGITRLIAPPLITNGIANLSVSFGHYFDDYGPGVTAKLQYSHDMNSWVDTGWSISSGLGDLTGTMNVSLTGLSGEYTYVAWVLEGNHFMYDYWYVDDVSFGYPLFDVAPLRIDTQEVVDYDTFTPQATVINNGNFDASFYVTFTLGDYYYANTQTVMDLAPGATRVVSFPPVTGFLNFTIPMRVTTHYQSDHDSFNDQIGKDLTTLYLDKQVFADAVHTSIPALKGPSTFNLKNPGTITHLGTPSVTPSFMVGGDWIGNAWFTVEWDNGTLSTDNYYRINHHTGAATLLGETGADLYGIAWDSNHNLLYGTDLLNLYALNIATGTATLIGSHVNTNWMIGIAYDNYVNKLYGVSLSPDALYEIDLATGYATEVGPLGIDINFGQDIAFDREHGYLFLAGYRWIDDPGPRLFWIDTSTGHASKIGNFPADYQIAGFAIPSAPMVLNLWIGSNGALHWDLVPGVSSYKIYGSNDPYAATFSYLGGTTSNSWMDPSFPQMKRFYYVTAVYVRTDTEPAVVRYKTEYKDPRTSELLDPQPVLKTLPLLLPGDTGEPFAGMAR